VAVHDLSVRYRIPHERLPSFKEYAIRRLQRRIVFEDFWALRDVNLTLAGGEAVGIVGRNGAGKSTLLRVIARVLRPTTGRVIVRGRLAPLLEVGAGFHPELTGRENVFLNGTLLGRTRHEIEEKLDDIVAFAEMAEFMDAPLRTYSSGMAARLGFAVATAWTPDVLLVDELLAVGDEAFREKCLELMGSFRRANIALVVVSHDLSIISTICDRALWLDRGTVIAHGSVAEVTQAYRGAALTA
jgi:ABC-type polysaccharide/polyol phosphate transport system ATPase subunit